MTERRCGTCRHWRRTPGKRVYADTALECDAPLPVECLPDSVRLAANRVEPNRRFMSRDEGRECPAWEAR